MEKEKILHTKDKRSNTLSFSLLIELVFYFVLFIVIYIIFGLFFCLLCYIYIFFCSFQEVPEGASDCLAGLTFVISGTLDR